METDFRVLVVETYFKAKKVDVSLLSDYFIKEQKETDSLNPKVFFAECEHAITTLKDMIDIRYMARKEELTLLATVAEANGDERSAELNKGELEFWSKDRVGIDLYDLTERLDWGERKSSNSINLQDFKVISEALEEARKIAIGREVPGIPTPPESPQPKYSTLAESFKSIADYNSVTSELKSEGYISDTGTWQDYGAAYKTALASMIKWLAANGYCKKASFTWQEIKSYCINDFAIDGIGRSTILEAPPILLQRLKSAPKT